MCNGGVVRVLLCNFGGGVVITYTISCEISEVSSFQGFGSCYVTAIVLCVCVCV